MAPERIRGTLYTFTSDSWSAGVVALECVHGRHPFKGEGLLESSFFEMANNICTGPPPR